MSWKAIEIGDYGTKARMEAFAAGVEAHGGCVVTERYSNHGAIAQECRRGEVRFAYTSGMHHAEAAARGVLAALGIPLLVLDCGYFLRASDADDTRGYNQLGLGRLCWRPREQVPADRWEALGLPIAPRPPAPSQPQTVLVLGQVPNDSQHHLGDLALAAWLRERAAWYRTIGAQIVFRPHPKATGCGLGLACARHEPGLVSLEESLAEADLVITYNSTAGLEALRRGIPVICDRRCHYFMEASDDMPSLRELFFHQLAYAQWTCDELADGTALGFMCGHMRHGVYQ